MLSLVLTILSGVAVGYLLRRRLPRLWVLRGVSLLIGVLLFLLGLEAGGNPAVVASLSTLGVEALVYAVAGLVGSCLTAWILWRIAGGKTDRRECPCGQSAGISPGLMGTWRSLRGSVLTVGCFAAGCVLGVLGWWPSAWVGGAGSMVALYGLLFGVGMSVGSDPATLRNVRTLRPAWALLPLMTMVGTLGATAVVWALWPGRGIGESLAVGAGFGYYSLSSVLISDLLGAEPGMLALLANVAREVITLLAAPLIVRVAGRLALIACGGASSMDSTLPVITQFCGAEYVALAVAHGFVVDFSVPFYVSFFCSL